MKKLLTILFVFVWSGIMAQELTADSPAVGPSAWEQIAAYAVNAFAKLQIRG